MKLVFYGRLGELIGRELEFALPRGDCSVAELRQMLAAEHPHARRELSGASARACVNDRLVDEQFRIDSGAEVAFLPPLSGG